MKQESRHFSDESFNSWMQLEKQKDVFFPEEDKMIEYIKEYAKTHSKFKRG